MGTPGQINIIELLHAEDQFTLVYYGCRNERRKTHSVIRYQDGFVDVLAIDLLSALNNPIRFESQRALGIFEYLLKIKSYCTAPLYNKHLDILNVYLDDLGFIKRIEYIKDTYYKETTQVFNSLDEFKIFLAGLLIKETNQ